MTAMHTCIQKNTGLEVETLRRALPATEEPICSLNATQLGRRLGMSARVMNQHLAASGLQHCNARDEWELTDRGQEWAEALPTAVTATAVTRSSGIPPLSTWCGSSARAD